MQRGYRYNLGKRRKKDTPPATHTGGHTPLRPACRPRAGALRKDPAGALAGSAAAQSPGFAAALLDGSGVRLPAGVAGVTPRARWGRRKVGYPGPPGAGSRRRARWPWPLEGRGGLIRGRRPRLFRTLSGARVEAVLGRSSGRTATRNWAGTEGPASSSAGILAPFPLLRVSATLSFLCFLWKH